MSNQAIFIFTIGPVQSFIAQARKARDLYAGSYLLAYVTGRTIKAMIMYDHKIEVVFPTVNNDYNIPNRVVAIVNDYDDDKKKNLGSYLENVARGVLTEISENLIGKTNKNIKEDLKKLYQNQIASHLEVFWLFHDFENYREGYQEAIKQLSEIKRLKPFHQNTECCGRKCSLNPDKNVLFSNMAMQNNQLIAINKDNFPYVLGEKEGLSAMGFVKRVLYLDDVNIGEGFQKSFPSVDEIVLRNKLRDENYVKSLEAIGSENCHLILDVYNGVAVKINEKNLNERSALESVKSLVEEIKKEEAKTGKRLLTSYYAIVKFDGDNMGDLYKNAELKNGIEFKQFHQELSKKLCAFASSVKSDVKKEEGEVIYTGGEDFLGFIAIDSLFPVLQRLRTTFKSIDLSQYINVRLTFSAGIAIAHVKTPLKQVANMSDEMEAFAKSIDTDKDAFAVSVMKRSGNHLKMRLNLRLNLILNLILLKPFVN